ncbi:MAG: caspase family protein, partial [Cyanobacteria bacterium P01_F01_bin.143]
MAQSSPEEYQSRRANNIIPPTFATHLKKWAIVVGISKHQDSNWDLKYAHRDAEELYDLLLTPTGGGFEEEKVVKLIDEEATTANITRALRSFLKKPAKDDVVLIYFACHGTPDSERPDILYLITHDTKAKDISGTALPMREVKLCIQENLLAERVIILADTCHSGGINRAVNRKRDVKDNSGAVNLYLREAAKANKGLAILTSAETSQVSVEDKKWGGGHGVFTHYLLEGMKGAADNNPKNGIVTIGELFDYIQEKVKEATNNQQHPCIGTEEGFDRNLPIAITADISAQEHYQVGCELYEIGKKLNDKHCLESASRHLQDAIKLAKSVKNPIPEAYLKNGLALMALQDFPKAIDSFEKAQDNNVDDASYYLGLIYLKQEEDNKAKELFEKFLSNQPKDEKISWVKKLLLSIKFSCEPDHYA